MPRWLAYALLATILWGGWAVAAKIATDWYSVKPYLVQALTPIGLAPVALALALSPGARVGRDRRYGGLYAFLTGLAAGVGNWLFFEALSSGPASVVGPLTAVFPVVTLVLALLFLRERLNVAQWAGTGLAAAAFVVFAWPDEREAAGPGGSGWLPSALAALFLFGIAGVTQKLSTNWISAEQSTLWFCLAFLVVGAAMLVWLRPIWDLPAAVWAWTVIVGLLNGLAILAAFAAYGAGGKAAVVTPLIALYPVITVALALPLFHERPSSLQWLGIVLSLCAAVGLALETPPATVTVQKTPSSQQE